MNKLHNLKPCPFCGKEETLPLYSSFLEVTHEHSNEYPYSPWYVMCTCCCQTARYETKQEAINAWNKRTDISLVKEGSCPYCSFPLSEHPNGEECYDDECICGRWMEAVNEYASTCDGCAELTMHENMTMDMKTQLGYCDNCVDEYIENNLNEDKSMYKIELYESKDGPRFRILAKNSNIIASSEAYASKGSRTRTVNQLIKNHNFKIIKEK